MFFYVAALSPVCRADTDNSSSSSINSIGARIVYVKCVRTHELGVFFFHFKFITRYTAVHGTHSLVFYILSASFVMQQYHIPGNN